MVAGGPQIASCGVGFSGIVVHWRDSAAFWARDLDAAGDGVLDLWGATGSPPSVTDSPDGLARLLTADPQALLIAELDGVTAGSLIAAWDGRRGSFYRLAVSPEHRRKGLAMMLLREGERRLRERGAVRLTAIVAEDDTNAMEFWKAVGYQRQVQRARSSGTSAMRLPRTPILFLPGVKVWLQLPKSLYAGTSTDGSRESSRTFHPPISKCGARRRSCPNLDRHPRKETA